MPEGVSDAPSLRAAGALRGRLLPQVQPAARGLGARLRRRRRRRAQHLPPLVHVGGDRARARAGTTGPTTTARWTSPRKHGIRTIIAELTHTVPDWALRKFAHARTLRRDGTPLPLDHGRLLGDRRLRQPQRRGRGAHHQLPRGQGGGRRLPDRARHPLPRPPGHARLRRLERDQLLDRRRLQPLHQGRLPRMAEGEVRQPRRARRGLAPLRPRRVGGRRAAGAGRPLSGMPRLARLQARQLLRPDAVAHRHHPRGRCEEPDRRPRRRQRHPSHGVERLRRLARRLQGRGLRLHLDPGAQGQPVLAQLLRRRHHPRRLARQALLARRAPGRPALDAAAGARPRQGGRPGRRARGHPGLVALVLRRRRPRHAEPALPPAARRAALRRLRLLRHGRLAHPAL